MFDSTTVFRSRRSWWLLAIGGLLACGEDQANPVRDAFAQAPPSGSPTAVALSFSDSAEQGVLLYRLPNLEQVAWRFSAPELTPRQIIGFSDSEEAIYLLTDSSQFVSFDLGSGRERVIDSLIAEAMIGPTQVTFLLRHDSTVGIVSGRRVETWATALPALPIYTQGTSNSRLLAVFENAGSRSLALLNEGWDGTVLSLPAGPFDVSTWGDLVLVDTDSGLVGIDPRTDDREFLQLDRHPTTLAISASGHRIYAGLNTGELLIVNRFSFSELGKRPLPGVIDDLRVDELGRVLLMRPAGLEEIWAIPSDRLIPGRDTLEVTRLEGIWGDQLPTIAPDGTLLVSQAEAVVAFDPETGVERGRVTATGTERLALISWDPRPPALQVAEDEVTPEIEAGTGTGLVYYAQISSTSNQDWARDLSTRLRQAGVDAQVMQPTEFYDRYRVVLGPYPTRQEADEIGRRLGRAYFVFSQEDTTTAR
jgi:hypothetical protein